MKIGGLSIGALSKQGGVNIETIRYYEKVGVMPAPARAAEQEIPRAHIAGEPCKVANATLGPSGMIYRFEMVKGPVRVQ
jgi:hypothetical protein